MKFAVDDVDDDADISHAFKTAKIIVFDRMMYIGPDVPLQDKLVL